jgi:hypothetical protein
MVRATSKLLSDALRGFSNNNHPACVIATHKAPRIDMKTPVDHFHAQGTTIYVTDYFVKAAEDK